MTYFKLNVDLNAIGKDIPQIQDAVEFGDFVPTGVMGNPPEGMLDLKKLIKPKMAPKSKITPLISSFLSLQFLIINEALLQVITENMSREYQSWPISIQSEKGKDFRGYNLFRINNSDISLYNFAKSTFYFNRLTAARAPEVKEYIQINSYQEYLNTSSEVRANKQRIDAEVLAIDTSKISSPFIRVNGIGMTLITGYYVSEELKTILESSFKGLSYMPIGEIKKVIEL